MALTLTVGSSFPAALDIAPAPKDGKPAPDPILINGSVGAQEGVTTGVDSKTYLAWLKANPEHPAVVGGLLRILPGGVSDVDEVAAAPEHAVATSSQAQPDPAGGVTSTPAASAAEPKPSGRK